MWFLPFLLQNFKFLDQVEKEQAARLLAETERDAALADREQVEKFKIS